MTPIIALRQQLKEQELDGMLVPMRDRFGCEYVPDCDRRLEWLTGFSGSNGFAIVMHDKAAFFTDGRYTLQMKQEIDQRHFDCFDMADKMPADWLKSQAKKRPIIGYDPWLFTEASLKAFEKLPVSLRPTRYNPIDLVWDDEKRPPAPTEAAFVHERIFAGVSATKKIEVVTQTMKQHKASVVLLCDSESINWLLNIRGADLPNTPIIRCYAAVYSGGKVELFVNHEQISPELAKALGRRVKIVPLADVEFRVKHWHKERVMVDEAKTPIALMRVLGDNVILREADPCALPKACKNKVEQKGMRDAHMRDGVALVEFFAWLDRRDKKSHLDEMLVAEKIEDFRAEQEHFVCPSFDTISGYNANGAVIHYRATELTNQLIDGNGLLLIDSGGQYFDGTTDVTRTIAIGRPSKQQMLYYTLVLKGHIALARAVFRRGTTGHALDVLAREPLWEYGVDYAHGTGHGVGHFLNVHEGPQNISPRSNDVALEEGMVLSNEPGYYQNGEFGIRIENLVMVQPAEVFSQAENFLCFKDLTMVPYDRRLIELSLLTKTERDWVNDYHAEVYKQLNKRVSSAAYLWLQAACAEI